MSKVAPLVIVIAVGAACNLDERETRHASKADLASFGTYGSALSKCLPQDAKDIRRMVNADVRHHWLQFTATPIAPEFLKEIDTGWVTHVKKPGSAAWWPSTLVGTLDATELRGKGFKSYRCSALAGAVVFLGSGSSGYLWLDGANIGVSVR